MLAEFRSVGERMARGEGLDQHAKCVKQMRARLEKIAQTGTVPPSRHQWESWGKSPGGRQLYELKIRNGWRVFAFKDGKRLLICTHMFKKPPKKKQTAEGERAGELCDSYFETKGSTQ